MTGKSCKENGQWSERKWSVVSGQKATDHFSLTNVLLYIFIFLLIPLPFYPYAQEIPLPIRFERISVGQGLSQSTVHCIIQDRKGFMWFGTWDGLNRYDGYQFTVFKNDPENPNTLSHNGIRCLYEDRKGIIWVGTESGGLNQFDPASKKFIRYQNQPDNPHSLSDNHVVSIYEDRHGSLWIGTEFGGLNKFDRKDEKFIRYQNQPDNPHSLSHNHVETILEDQNDILWIGTENGLNQFNPQNERFVYYKNEPGNPQSLSHNHIRSIVEDRHGSLWIGTQGGGLNRFDREKKEFIHYRHDPDDPNSISHDNVRLIYEDPWGTLWIGTEGGGLNRLSNSPPTPPLFEKERGARGVSSFIRYQHDPRDIQSISHDVVWSIFADRSGVLWIGTYTGGLNKYDQGKEQFIHYRNEPEDSESLSHNVVWSIYEDRDEIVWIGTENGLNRMDRKASGFTRYQNDPINPQSIGHNEIWAIYEDRHGVLWIGTYGGLYRFNRKEQVFKYFPNDPYNPPNNRIRSIIEDRQGVLWVGAAGGLYEFDREKEKFIRRYQHKPENPDSLSNNNIWILYEDKSGILWVGTEDGLNRFDRENEKFIRYKNNPGEPDSLSNNWILSIFETHKGGLWIGTVGGLNQFDRQKNVFKAYGIKDGLPNEVIYGILEDLQGSLWLSTNNGLSKFKPEIGSFKNYSVKDGLQSNEFNVGAYYRNRKGEMFFGGINGFNTFYPSPQDNPYPPFVVITDFRIFNEPVPVSKDSFLQKSIEYAEHIHLSYKERVFSFEFVSLHFASPEKNQHAYMLEGFDTDWIYSGTRRFVTYTNLSPGNYTFKIKGSNNDGLWNEQGFSVQISITPPPWKTWWAYTIYSMMGAVILFSYLRYKNKLHAEELAKHRKELEQKRQMAELLEQKVDERTFQLNMALEKIMSGIRYAQVIQKSLLPNPNQLTALLPDNFVIWMPRDIVGGDIFFVDYLENGSVILAVIDCTGHGVPGAFMTMIASSAMRNIIKDARNLTPSHILRQLNIIIKTTLQQDTEYALSDDGMDAAVCVIRLPEINNSNSIRHAYPVLTFAGARIPLIFTKNGQITVIKADKESLGYKRSDLEFKFTTHMIHIEKGMRFYLATDGFQDQLGNDEKSSFGVKRFGRKRFENIILKNSELTFDSQKEVLLKAFYEHMGERERQDDITVVGFGFDRFDLDIIEPVKNLNEREDIIHYLNCLISESIQFSANLSIAIFEIYSPELSDKIQTEFSMEALKIIIMELRGYDTAFQYSKNRLMAILPNTNRENAIRTTKRVIQSIEHIALETKKINLSVKSAVSSLEGKKDAAELIQNTLKQLDNNDE